MQTSKTYISKISATSGFLANCGEVHLRPGLNCIIGPPGSCKSVLIESIRFAFDHEADRVQELSGQIQSVNGQAFDGKIKATLEGGTVRCELEDSESGRTWTIERESGNEPRLYQDGVRELNEGTERLIEIYSQGQLQSIAERPDKALKFIDRSHHNQMVALAKIREQVRKKLAEAGSQVRLLRGQITSLQVEVRRLPHYRQLLDEGANARPQVSENLQASHENYKFRKRLSSAVGSAFKTRREALAALQNVTPLVNELREKLGFIDELVSQSDISKSISTDDFAICRDFLEQSWAFLEAQNRFANSEALRGGDESEAMTASCLERDDAYFALLQQEQQANEWMKAQGQLSNQITALEEHERQLEKLSRELTEWQQKREILRQQFQRCADDAYKWRASEVNDINRQHSQTVVLKLNPGADGSRYLEAMRETLSGSRLRDQDLIAHDLATAFMPSELIDLVEAGDATPLAQALGRESAQMTRLLSFLIDNPRLYELETRVFEDELEISMLDRGVLKSISQLSRGQKATALLPLILRKASHPLLFDQPEDDLDNRFISQEFVKALQRLKNERQIIFVTHNANIPVLGNADHIVVMRMESPTRAALPILGTVDESKDQIMELLEGGEQAFQQRRAIYERLADQKTPASDSETDEDW